MPNPASASLAVAWRDACRLLPAGLTSAAVLGFQPCFRTILQPAGHAQVTPACLTTQQILRDCNLPFSHPPAGGRHQLWLCPQPVCGPDLPVGQQQRLDLLPQLHRHRPEHICPTPDQPVRHDHAHNAGRAKQHLRAAHAGQRLIHVYESRRRRCAHLPCMCASMCHTHRRASLCAGLQPLCISGLQHLRPCLASVAHQQVPLLPHVSSCQDPLYPAQHPAPDRPWSVHRISGQILSQPSEMQAGLPCLHSTPPLPGTCYRILFAPSYPACLT